MIYEENVDDAIEHIPALDGPADASDDDAEEEDDNDLDQDLEAEKENQPHDATKPRTKKRKRKSIGQQSLRKKKRPSNEAPKATGPALVPPRTSTRSPVVTREVSIELGNGTVENRDAAALSDALEEDNSERSRPARKRRKRKSITFKRRKRASNEASRRVVDRQSTESTAVSEAESEIRGVDRDDSEDVYIEENASPEPETPAPARKGKGPRKPKMESEDGEDTKVKTSKASFPIVTQRLTNFDLLPTIDELGESDLDSDEERARDAERKLATEKSVPNTVDVLAQYCRETVESAVDKLNTGPSNNRAERKRQQTALETIGRELNDRLFEMSAAIDHRVQLESRTRRAKRSRAELQARWLEIRRQREEIALRCDHIRQQNWERERERESKWALSEAAHKLELEVERSEPEEVESLEYMLRTVAADVSCTQPCGGILDRIKTFNVRLERMAEVLEGRE